jgi:hypothetical protein
LPLDTPCSISAGDEQLIDRSVTRIVERGVHKLARRGGSRCVAGCEGALAAELDLGAISVVMCDGRAGVGVHATRARKWSPRSPSTGQSGMKGNGILKPISDGPKRRAAQIPSETPAKKNGPSLRSGARENDRRPVSFNFGLASENVNRRRRRDLALQHLRVARIGPGNGYLLGWRVFSPPRVTQQVVVGGGCAGLEGQPKNVAPFRGATAYGALRIRTYPPHSRLRSISRISRLYDLPCSGDFAPRRQGLRQLLGVRFSLRQVPIAPPPAPSTTLAPIKLRSAVT